MYCSETNEHANVRFSSLKNSDMKTLRRITGITYKLRITNKAVFKKTGLMNLLSYKCRHGYDGLAKFNKEKITKC